MLSEPLRNCELSRNQAFAPCQSTMRHTALAPWEFFLPCHTDLGGSGYEHAQLEL